jgi:hypothetical protein
VNAASLSSPLNPRRIPPGPAPRRPCRCSADFQPRGDLQSRNNHPPRPRFVPLPRVPGPDRSRPPRHHPAARSAKAAPTVRVHWNASPGRSNRSSANAAPGGCRARPDPGRGAGSSIYMRGHEGRGIGLINKLKAYPYLQEDSLDTLDANIALGFGRRSRLRAGLGETRCARSPTIGSLRQLQDGGITVIRQIPLVVGGRHSAGDTSRRSVTGWAISFPGICIPSYA